MIFILLLWARIDPRRLPHYSVPSPPAPIPPKKKFPFPPPLVASPADLGLTTSLDSNKTQPLLFSSFQASGQERWRNTDEELRERRHLVRVQVRPRGLGAGGGGLGV